MKKFITSIIVILTAITSCSKLDVVGTDSVRAFSDMLNVLPASSGDVNTITAPDNSARFIWTGEDAVISFDIAPFVNAGLDVSNCNPT